MIQLSHKDYDDKSKDEIIDELFDKIREIEKLKNELRKYKNPNTPPSANQHLKPTATSSGLSARHKQGAPRGHPGTTRFKQLDAEEQHIPGVECPNCHSSDIEVIGQRIQQIEELPPEIKPKVRNVCRDKCQCKKCGLKFLARDGITPLEGKFGLNLIVLVIFLKFILRGVLRKTTSFLEAGFAFKLAPASVQAIIQRAAKAGEKEYNMLKEKIRSAKILYIDETSFSVLGKNWWVWAFRSDTNIMLVIRNSRGNKVLEEILGKGYSGTVICDCWRAYDYLVNAVLQRCWAHLLRKSAELTSIPGKHLHRKLSKMFDQIVRFNSKERTDEHRQKKYKKMTRQLKKWVSYYSQYEECKPIAKYISFHIESWLTCVKIPGIQPTNNFAEQAIRETVLVRKIIGAFRSKSGSMAYETLASLIADWQFQKLDLKNELYRMLSVNLC